MQGENINFRANFDWILKEKNFVCILELEWYDTDTYGDFKF